MIFKTISIACIVIVAAQLITLVVLLFAIIAPPGKKEDEGILDNSTGKLICAGTGHTCIYSRVTPISCDNCPERRDLPEDD